MISVRSASSTDYLYRRRHIVFCIGHYGNMVYGGQKGWAEHGSLVTCFLLGHLDHCHLLLHGAFEGKMLLWINDIWA